MKRTSKYMAAAVISFAGMAAITSCNEYRIEGNIDQKLTLGNGDTLQTPATIYLIDAYTEEKMDSTTFDKESYGKFRFSGKLEQPTIVTVVFSYKKPDSATANYSESCTFPLERGTTTVFKNTELNRYSVAGTPIADEFTEFYEESGTQMMMPQEAKEYLTDRYEAGCKTEMAAFYFSNLLAYIDNYNTADSLLSLGHARLREFPVIKRYIEYLRNKELSVPGKKFADFRGTDPLTDNTLAISDFAGKGKRTVLEFWGSWCAPCRESMPEMKKIVEKHKDDAYFISIAINDTKEKCAAVTEQLGITWPVILFENDAPAIGYAINYVPYLVVISESGEIEARGINLPELRELLEK